MERTDVNPWEWSKAFGFSQAVNPDRDLPSSFVLGPGSDRRRSGYSAYAPTKFAVRGLGETLRGELKPYGIHVGIAYPPDTETPGFERENLIKPAETAAISASTKPRSAEVVGEAIAEAIARNKLTITADAQSPVLAGAIGVVGPLVRASMDATVRKVQRGRPR